jgi:hypothetical protein
LNGGTWRISLIDALDPNCAGEHGEIQLMFFGSKNTPAVAYHTHTLAGGGARYAVCAGVGCTSPGAGGPSWTKQDVDTANNAGHYMTAYVDPISKQPRIAYQDQTTWNLHFGACSGTCDLATGSWTIGKVEPVVGGGVSASGYWSSMALSPNGTLGIVFEDTMSNQERVRLATCQSNCSDASNATWAITTLAVPGGNSSNYFPSLQYDAQNQAHVTYIDSNTKTLRYAIQLGNTTNFQYFDIDHGVDDGHSSFVLTPAGSTHVSYALTTGLKYYPFGD